jgi:hypothetical protein
MSNKKSVSWKNIKILLLLGGIICSLMLFNLAIAPGLRAQEEKGSQKTRELLANMNIYLYPEKEELKEIPFDSKWIEGIPLSSEDVNADFSNFDDLQWLKPIAQKNKVFLLGEYHYYQTIQHLRNRILFALNTFDSYPLLIIELQYSLSGFFDYYVGLTDDKEAEDYYQNVIYDLVGEEESYELLEHLRSWNKMHPDKRIHIGSTDVEHDYTGTLRRVIVPYFKLLNPSFNIDYDTFSLLDLEELLPKLEEQLKEAKAKNIVGKYSFLTPQYIECVLENLKSTRLCYKYDFNYYRQRAIVRNLTDPRFFGKYLTEGKVMIHGGAYHTPSHFPYPDGGNFYREGSYLSYDFESTKGKTYSLALHGFAYQIGPMAEVDLDKSLHHGSGYKGIVKSFQGAYKQGLVSPEDYYLFWRELNEFDKFLFTAAYKYNHHSMLVKNIDWDKVIEKAKESSSKLYNSVRMQKDMEYDPYDANILVFRSPITRVKMKKAEE